MNVTKTGRAILLGLVIGVLITQFGLSLMRVHGHSMDPSLFAGELVVVLRPPVLALAAGLGAATWAQAVRGAVVVVPQPRSEGVFLGMGRPLIVKRVIGLPLEQLAFQRGTLLVDGVELPEPWVSEQRRGASNMLTRTVPEGHVFLAGDNRLPLASSDSRQFGALPISSLRGRLVAQLRLPWGEGGLRWPLVPLL